MKFKLSLDTSSKDSDKQSTASKDDVLPVPPPEPPKPNFGDPSSDGTGKLEMFFNFVLINFFV